MSENHLKNVIEAALLAADRPLNLDALIGLFDDHERPERKAVREALDTLAQEYEGRGVRLAEVASGYRVQVREEMSEWLSRLWQERPPRYSRALMETLALVAYRQPITRGEIEDIRGVSVSTNIVRTLMERNWVRIVGHRDVPGKPAMYATTREFLDYFGLKSLESLPPLSELTDIDSINVELDLPSPDAPPSGPASLELVAGAATVAGSEEVADEAGAADAPVDAVPGAVADAGEEQVPAAEDTPGRIAEVAPQPHDEHVDSPAAGGEGHEEDDDGTLADSGEEPRHGAG